MARSDRQIRNATFAVGFTLTATIALAWFLGWLEAPEKGLYDIRARRFQQFTPKPSDKIVHVDIDDAALEAVGAWPWPRTKMADIIDEISLAGAKAIVLDILYAEPQEVQYRPTPDGRSYTATDHDANLAKAIARAGNVLVPASLSFSSARTQSAATAAAEKILSAAPQTPPDAVLAQLKAQGSFTDQELAEVESIFLTLRREAVLTRVEQEMRSDLGDAHGHHATTRPATAPSDTAVPPVRPPAGNLADTAVPQTGPAATAMYMPNATEEEAIKRRLMAKLFPASDPTIPSPELRLIDEGYDRALAERHLDGFTRPGVPGLQVFAPRSEIHPIHVLLGSAAASGYVDYPNFGDGTVRSVPLFMKHKDRLLPQMGLRAACMMLEVDPADLKITQDSVTIPAGTLSDGTPRAERVIPLRTESHSFTSGRTIEMPLMMDIAWFGGGRWWTMYAPDQPNAKAQHVSMALLHEAAEMVRRRERGVQGMDRAARDLVGLITANFADKAGLAGEYEKRVIKGENTTADAETAGWLLKEAAETLTVTPDMKLDNPSDDKMTKLAITYVHVLAIGPRESANFKAALDRRRAELKSALAGKCAVLGWTSTSSIADTKPTPLHGSAPGVVIHGVLTSNVLSGDFWSTAPAWVNLLLVLAMGFFVSVAVAKLSPVWSLIVAVAMAGGYIAINCVLLFDYGNKIVELTAPLLAIVGPWAGGTITRLVIETREKARITRRLGSYVDQDLVDYVLESRDETIFSGQERETTVVFTDLEGFTKLSDKLKKDVVPILNEYMGRATVVIKKHKGFVNKFLGDGILFFFNAPRPNSTFVADAMDCLLDLQVMMQQFNAELLEKGHTPLRMRAGMTTAKVIAGDAGSRDHADYTVLGDDVNLAARLESANKFFGTLMLVTDVSMKAAGDRFLFRPVGVIQVSGRSAGVMTYEPLAWMKDATPQDHSLAALTTAVYMKFSENDAAGCLAAIDVMEKAVGESKLTKVYRRMCDAVIAGEEPALPKEIVLSEK